MSEESKLRSNEVFAANQEQQVQPKLSHAVRSESQLLEEFGLTVPTDNAPLPSGGIVYPADHPFHGQEFVAIRAMTAREEDILTSRSYVRSGTVITHLIKSCLIDRRVDPRLLLAGDRNALLTAIRVTGYGSDYVIEVECPSCTEKNEYKFNLSELEVKRLDLVPVVAGENLFSFTLPKSGANIQWRFMTGYDDEEVMQESANRKKARLSEDNLVTRRVSRMIMSFNGVTDKSKIALVVPRLSAFDTMAFRNYVTEHEPGIEMRSDFVCPSCGDTAEVDVPIGTNFFWPTAKKS